MTEVPGRMIPSGHCHVTLQVSSAPEGAHVDKETYVRDYYLRKYREALGRRIPEPRAFASKATMTHVAWVIKLHLIEWDPDGESHNLNPDNRRTRTQQHESSNPTTSN